MIFGIGIDLIEIRRVKKLVDSNQAFIDRIFTSFEQEYCKKKKNYSESYAARFAAKEDFMKAMGTGCRDGLNFTDIEVRNNEFGKPVFTLYNKALEFIYSKNIIGINLSLSHSKDLATAIVILEKK